MKHIALHITLLVLYLLAVLHTIKLDIATGHVAYAIGIAALAIYVILLQSARIKIIAEIALDK